MEPEELEDVDPNKICCLNCRFFEDRNCFCRRNPPVPMQIRIGEQIVTTSMFCKPGLPTVDWCGEFSRRDSNE